jgi:uncharacterized protein (TIGR03083 family)
MQGPVADEFSEAATWLVSLVARVPKGAWERQGLGVWDVRSLVGHAARALATVEDYLATPVAQIDVRRALDYLSAAASASPEAIAARGVAAGEALGSDLLASVTAMADRATALVASSPADALLSTIAGGMTLEAYLPTRTLELIVHGCDLAAALGLDADPPEAPARAAARLLLEVQLHRGSASAVLLALAGRPITAESLTIWPSESLSSH